MPDAQVPDPARLPQPVDSWLTPARFAALLGVLLAASFPMVLLGLRAFAYLDYGQFAYPVASYTKETFARGELPFWNPLNSCGLPFLAQWNVQSLYPFSLFYVLFPLPWSLGVFCLLHLFLGGMGMYFLARNWTENSFAAAAAGSVFAFNGFSWYAIVWPHITAAAAWMPWVVLANEQAWSRGGRALVLASLVSALQLLSGGAEVILLSWGFLAGLFVWKVVSAGKGAGALFFRACVTGLLALALAAPQLLPFLELLSQSQRSAGFGSADLGVMPAGGWANYLVPLFHTLKNPQGLHVPPNHWVGSYYLGGGIILLGCFGLLKVRSPRVWLLAGFSVFGVLMAMGSAGPVYNLVCGLVPGLGFVRFPVKFVILATFALPLLAASGLAWWTSGSEHQTSSAPRLLLRALIVFGILMALIVWWSRIYPSSPTDAPATFHSALSRAVLLAGLGALLVLLHRLAQLSARQQGLLRLAVLGLLWLDVLTHNANLSPTVSPAILEKNAIRQFFGWSTNLSAGNARLVQSPASYQRMLAVGYTDLEMDTQGRRLGQFFNYNLLDSVPKVDGFYSLYPRECAVLFDRLYFGTNRAEPLKDFLSASLTTHPTNIVDWVPRPAFLPMITIGQAPVFTNSAAALECVLSDGFEPRRTVYLPSEAEKSLSSAVATPEATARLSRFSASELVVDVETPHAAVLVVNQTFYPRWKATVNGQPARLWRANFGFQALSVPPGQSQVRLNYSETGFYHGLALCGLALVITVAILIRNRPRPHG